MLVLDRLIPALAPYVRLLWHDERYAASVHRERILPPGAFTLTIELGSGIGTLNGMRSTYIELDTAPVHSVVGVLFRPGGWRAFVDASGTTFFNQSIPVDLVWGNSDANRLVDRLRETSLAESKLALLEETLLGKLRPHGDLHLAVQRGLEVFHDRPHVCRVLDVVGSTGLSRRRFSQLFREQVGLTPKLYCRLHRFHRVIHQVASGTAVDWADVAAAGGYSDQAHLTHEFRDFSGLSPSVFLGAERPSGAHVRVS